MPVADLERRTGESFADRYFLAVLVEWIERLSNSLVRIGARMVIRLADEDPEREEQLLLLRFLGNLSVALYELERVLKEELFA